MLIHWLWHHNLPCRLLKVSGDQFPTTDDQFVKLAENSQDSTAGKQLQQPDPIIYCMQLY